jgi:hypothetical protein
VLPAAGAPTVTVGSSGTGPAVAAPIDVLEPDATPAPL